MKIYDGGSDKDELLRSVTGNYAPPHLTSMRNQVYVMYTTNGNEVGKGFTAKIMFGIMITTYTFMSCIIGNITFLSI